MLATGGPTTVTALGVAGLLLLSVGPDPTRRPAVHRVRATGHRTRTLRTLARPLRPVPQRLQPLPELANFGLALPQFGDPVVQVRRSERPDVLLGHEDVRACHDGGKPPVGVVPVPLLSESHSNDYIRYNLA